MYFLLKDLKEFPEYGINIASEIWNSLFYISLIIIAVGLFCKSKITMAVGAGANVLLNAIFFILDLIFVKYPTRSNYYFIIFMLNILIIAAYAVLLLLLISSCRKADAVIKYLWYLPSLIMLIYYIIYYVVAIFEYDFNVLFGIGIAIAIVQVVALFFAGLWLKTGTRSSPAKKYEQSVGVS